MLEPSLPASSSQSSLPECGQRRDVRRAVGQGEDSEVKGSVFGEGAWLLETKGAVGVKTHTNLPYSLVMAQNKGVLV